MAWSALFLQGQAAACNAFVLLTSSSSLAIEAWVLDHGGESLKKRREHQWSTEDLDASSEATEDDIVSITTSKVHTCDLIGLDFLRVERGRESEREHAGERKSGVQGWTGIRKGAYLFGRRLEEQIKPTL